MYCPDCGVSDESAYSFRECALLQASNQVWLGHDSGVVGHFIFINTS